MGEGEEAGSLVGEEEGEQRHRRRGIEANATGKKGKREGGRRGGGRAARGGGGGISRWTAVGRGAMQVLPAREGNGLKGKKITERRKRKRYGKKIPKK